MLSHVCVVPKSMVLSCFGLKWSVDLDHLGMRYDMFAAYWHGLSPLPAKPGEREIKGVEPSLGRGKLTEQRLLGRGNKASKEIKRVEPGERN